MKTIQIKLLKPITILYKRNSDQLSEIEKDNLQKSIDEWQLNYHKSDNYYN